MPPLNAFQSFVATQPEVLLLQRLRASVPGEYVLAKTATGFTLTDAQDYLDEATSLTLDGPAGTR